MDQTEAFHILASADRQLVLHELVEWDGTVSLGELSRTVAARRHQLSPENVDEKMTERAHSRLVDTHLPTLAESDIIHPNWGTEKVKLTDRENVDQLFELSEDLESWPPDDLLEHPSRSW